MGIDVYAHWATQNEAEAEAQNTGFSIEAGHVGYLREAYHGGPYATKALVPESWDDDKYEGDDYDEDQFVGVPIAAATLRARLPRAVVVSLIRDATVYKDGNARLFLAEYLQVEAKVTSDPVPGTVHLSDGDNADDALKEMLSKVFTKFVNPNDEEPGVLPAISSKTIATARAFSPMVESLCAFVELCERKEQETGQPCRIWNSH